MHIVFDLASRRIRWAALVPRPDDLSAFLHSLLAGEGRRETITVTEARDLESPSGWPLSLYRIEGAEGARLVALYHFLEWLGVAVTDGDDAEVRAAVGSGRPDFRRREAICLADVLRPEVVS